MEQRSAGNAATAVLRQEQAAAFETICVFARDIQRRVGKDRFGSKLTRVCHGLSEFRQAIRKEFGTPNWFNPLSSA